MLHFLIIVRGLQGVIYICFMSNGSLTIAHVNAGYVSQRDREKERGRP